MKEDLTGRYLKILKNFRAEFAIGDYYKINNVDTAGDFFIKDKIGNNACLTKSRIHHEEIELMPEGWEPGQPTKVEVFPGIFVGDVIVNTKDKEDYGVGYIIGTITVVHLQSSEKRLITYHNGSKVGSYWHNFSNHRLATPEEVTAFQNGVKNINDMKKEEVTPQFEVGKWYKNLGIDGGYYGKFKEFQGSLLWVSEYIDNRKRHTASKGNIDYKRAELVTDLSEIQSCLPEGHVDKQPVDLIGRYVKALNDYPYGGDVKKGEYGLIVRDNTQEYVVDFSSQKSYFIRKTCIPSDKIELMPIGFNPMPVPVNPKTEEWIPQVGDWVTVVKYIISEKAYDGYTCLGQTFKAGIIKPGGAHGSYTMGYKIEGKSPGGIYTCDLRKATQAEIDAVTKPKEEDLLAEANRRYPPGTKFIDAREPRINYGSDRQTIITGDTLRIWSESPIEIDAYGRGFVYSDGKWAEIVESPKTESIPCPDISKAGRINKEEKWQVGGYIRATQGSHIGKVFEVLKISKNHSPHYGDLIICGDSTDLKFWKEECQWLGMQKPVEPTIFGTGGDIDRFGSFGMVYNPLESRIKSPDECFKPHEIIKMTEPVMLKKAEKINYLTI